MRQIWVPVKLMTVRSRFQGSTLFPMDYLDRCSQIHKPWVTCESQRDGFSRMASLPRAQAEKCLPVHLEEAV